MSFLDLTVAELNLPHDIQSLKNSKSFRDALENHYQSYKFTTTENFHIPLSSAFS